MEGGKKFGHSEKCIIYFNLELSPCMKAFFVLKCRDGTFIYPHQDLLKHGSRNFKCIFTTIFHPSRMEISVQKSLAEA